MIRKRLGGDVVVFRLHDRIQHDVVLGVSDAGGCDQFGFPGAFRDGDHFRVLSHPAPPVALHLLFGGFLGGRIGLGPFAR